MSTMDFDPAVLARQDQIWAMIRDLAQRVVDQCREWNSVGASATVELGDGELECSFHREHGLIVTASGAGSSGRRWRVCDPEGIGVRL